MNGFQSQVDNNKDGTNSLRLQKKSLPFQNEKLSLGFSSSSEYQNTVEGGDEDQTNSESCKNSGANSPFTKSSRIKECIQQSISAESKKKISSLLNEVHQLSDLEKLLLYIQLPTGAPPNVDPLKQKSPGNPLGKKADIAVAQTYTWIQSHLEEDPEVSLPKQEIYEEYKLFCDANKIEGLCAADFGKVMKYVFPSVKPRRLGTRGNSRYCYSGLRKKLYVDTPSLPDLSIELENLQDAKSSMVDDEMSSAASCLVFEWAEKLLNKKFESLPSLASHLVENLYVDTRSVAAFTILSSSTNHNAGGRAPQGNLLLKSSGTNKRRETQLHLQRKLQEKELIREQKKKLQEQRSIVSKNCKPNGCRKGSKKDSAGRAKSNGANGIEAAKSEILEKNVLLMESSIKKEETEKSSNGNTPPQPLSPLKPVRCYSEGAVRLEQELIPRPKKVPITRKTSSPGACFSQSVPSIIILPSIQTVEKCSATVQKPTSHKYKRIQPKPSQYSTTPTSTAITTLPSPTTINMDSNSEKTVCGYSLELAEANGFSSLHDSSGRMSRLMQSTPKTPEVDFDDKSNVDILKSISASLSRTTQSLCVVQSDLAPNRKSLSGVRALSQTSTFHSVPLTTPVAKKGKRSLSSCKESKCKINHPKRVLEDAKTNRPFKKPLMDSLQCGNDKISLDSQTTTIAVLSGELEDNSITSVMNIELDTPNTNSIDEVSVQHIETDALMEEYLHGSSEGGSAMDSFNTNLSKVNDSTVGLVKLEIDASKSNQPTNKAQLSQLRLLLQRNLPPTSSSRVSIIKPSSAVSEENSVLDSFSHSGLSELRQAILSNNRQSPFRSQSEPSSFLFNWNGIDMIQQPLQIGDSIVKVQSSLVSENRGNQTLEETKLYSSASLDLCSSDYGTTVLADEQALIMPITSTQSESGLEDLNLARNHFENINEDVPTLDKSNHSSYISSYTQVPSVPPSPNTRRRAFNFMPISPRQTPIPENLGFANVGSVSTVSSASPLQMYTPTINVANISVAVGPSQPPSTASSPFVSPRGTPVPISRSRHNSGQSAYSTPRQTPSQNFVDSGVSSISTSPFVSPQTTPVPVSRLRHNSNHGGTGKTVTFSTAVSQGCPQSGLSFQCRSRHNSGPLPPPLAASSSTTTSGIISYFMSPRSAPLSPLVGENYTQTNFNFPNTVIEGTGNVRSRHSSASSINVPMSPLSNPVSPSGSAAPSSHLIGNSDPLVGASDNSVLSNNIAKKLGLLQNEDGRNISNLWNGNNRLPSVSSLKTGNQFSWPSSIPDGPFCQPVSSALQKRNRHVSGSVIHHRPSNSDLYNQEIQSFLQSSSPSSPNAVMDSTSRSRSVPLQQMLEQLSANGGAGGPVSISDCSGSFNFGTSANPVNEDIFTRSYPSTPMKESFPLTVDSGGCNSYNEENLASPFAGNCGQFSEENSQKEQDLGAQRDSGLNNWANPLGTLSSRRNISELLEGDYLQTTLEDLRDCDNDFSKFAQELEQMDQSKEPDY